MNMSSMMISSVVGAFGMAVVASPTKAKQDLRLTVGAIWSLQGYALVAVLCGGVAMIELV